MKYHFITGLTLPAMALSIATPAQAEKFPWRLLEVDKVELCDIEVDDNITIIYKDYSCKQIIPTKDVMACLNAGGQVGSIGTRPVCVNERVQQTRPRGAPPPFFPEEVMAKSFVPVTVPVELYNGQKDPRAAVGRPRPIKQIPVRTD